MRNSNRIKRAFTLVELLVSISIFSIAFVAILISNGQSNIQAHNSIISFTSLHYARSLLEVVQSYPYQDSEYGNLDNAQHVFDQHDSTFVTFESGADKSGLYTDAGSWVKDLPEQGISLRYFPTQSVDDPNSPFNRSLNLQGNSSLLGPEDDDHAGIQDFGPGTGRYRISQTQYNNNIFGFNTDELSGKDLTARYYFMDDVDDFDGYYEEREVLPGVIVTFEISVLGVYSNFQNFKVEYTNLTNTLTTKFIKQDPFAIMQRIRLNPFPVDTNGDEIEFDDSSNPTLEAQTQGVAYYKQMLFKKITIKATWEYPPQSGVIKTIVIDGGAVNPEGIV